MVKEFLVQAWINEKEVHFTQEGGGNNQVSTIRVKAGDWRAAFSRGMAIVKTKMKKGSRPQNITLKITNTNNI